MMEMQMVFANTSDSEDEDTKASRMAAREDKNREWRRERELGRWRSCGLEPPPSPTSAREEHRLAARGLEKELYHLLLCTACGAQLLPQAWQCGQGHLTCSLCFDEENIGRDPQREREEEEEREGRRRLLAALQRSLSSLLSPEGSSSSSPGTGSSTAGSSSSSSNGPSEKEEQEEQEDEEQQEEQEGTSVRKDAIDFYSDYNNEGKTIFYDPDIEALKLENGSAEAKKVESDLYRDEKSEAKLAYMERLRHQGSLDTLRETLVDVVQTAAQEGSPSWAKFRLEELTFFLDNLLEKQTVDYYGDYHQQFQSIFEQVDMSDWWVEGGSAATASVTSEEEEDAPRVTRCRVCNEFIEKRNLQVERVAQIFFEV